ncbi:MAG: hypothetical protein H8M99_02470 [Gloeobacteraceae cyanobacterium ES-bin-144]|nr:hypothetical protein [Verrucomicrobiales bacterium]
MNNTLPQVEASTTGWSFADAFPNLSFDVPTILVPLPNTNKLLVATQKGVIHSFVDNISSTTKSVFLDLSALTQGNVGSVQNNVSVLDTVTIAEQARRFLRLRVVLP